MFKIMLMFYKWYLKLLILYWAFIGISEAALHVWLCKPVSVLLEKDGLKKGRRILRHKINERILKNALRNWKLLLGFTNKKSDENTETEKQTEEKTEEPEA